MKNNVVLYEKRGPIGLVTINRPEVRNALNMAVFKGLDGVLDQVAGDETVKALIVTGSGNSFVAGADINELLSFDTRRGWEASRYQQSVFNKLERIGKPSVAAINGFAMGGGLELALACTFRIASTKAKLGFPELGLGIIPAFGGTERSVRVVGYAKASELVLLHSIIDGEEALKIGLVNLTVEPAQVLEKAGEWAKDLASLSPVAVRLELELLRETEKAPIDQGLALESALGALAVASAEAKELLGRFVAKGK
jgi:enoyl-CoA hydratase